MLSLAAVWLLLFESREVLLLDISILQNIQFRTTSRCLSLIVLSFEIHDYT